MARGKHSTAVHEAGHAALDIALSLGCERVTVVPDYKDHTAGSTTHGGEWGRPARRFGEEDDDTARLRMIAEEVFWLRHAISCYAGAEAVRQLCPKVHDPDAGADSDKKSAFLAIDNITRDGQTRDLLNALAQRRCTVLVEHYGPEIMAIARALESKGSLSGDAARKVFTASLNKRRACRMSF